MYMRFKKKKTNNGTNFFFGHNFGIQIQFEFKFWWNSMDAMSKKMYFDSILQFFPLKSQKLEKIFFQRMEPYSLPVILFMTKFG